MRKCLPSPAPHHAFSKARAKQELEVGGGGRRISTVFLVPGVWPVLAVQRRGPRASAYPVKLQLACRLFGRHRSKPSSGLCVREQTPPPAAQPAPRAVM